MHTGFRHLEQSWDQIGQREDAPAHVYVADAEHYDRTGELDAERVTAWVDDPASKTIVEVGSGVGRVTKYLSQKFAKVYAVDIAASMVERVAALGLPNVTTIQNDGTDLFWRVHKPDVVYSYLVLMHNRKADAARVIRELTACLPVGGRIVFQLPCYAVGKEPINYTDVGVWTRAEIERLLLEQHCKPLQIAENPGAFAWDAVGPRHYECHVGERVD